MERRVLRRRRPALSCISCRRRKIKCDRNSPCGQCVLINSHCTFQPFDKQPPEAEASPRPRSQALPDTPPSSVPHETTEQVAQCNAGGDPAAIPIAATLSQGSEKRRRASEAHDESHAYANETHNLIESLSETGRHILARQSGLGDADAVLNKTRILRWSNWVGAAKEFQVIGTCYAEVHGSGNSTSFQEESTKELTREIGVLLAKCKAISRALKASRPARSLSSPALELPPSPDRDVAREMTQLYLDSFESSFRIFHVPSLWDVFERFWNQPQGLRADERLAVLIVIGLGSSLCTAEVRQRDNLEEKIQHWIYAAETWLSGPLEKDRLSIGGIQLHCLLILVRQVFSIGGDLVWTSIGSLIHRAMQMGFHRDPKFLPPMTVFEAELRRRLWATILEMALQASLDSALPPRISLDDFDTEAPANISDEDLQQTSDTIQPLEKGFTSASVQIALLEALPIRLRIVQSLNSLRTALTYSDTLELNKEIHNICRAHSRLMKDYADAGMTAFHRNLLDYLVRRFFIPLNCPFANQARSNPLFHNSLRLNFETAVAIISPEPDEGWSQLMLIAGGMFREGIRYANTVIGLEFIAQTEHQVLNGTFRGGNAQYIDWLRKLVHDMMDLALKRIAHGEMNVKSHMFMNMLLAQASCIERGMPCEHEVARGARDSLQVCHGLLKERVGSFPLPSPSVGMIDADDWNDQWAGFDLGFFLYDTEGF